MAQSTSAALGWVRLTSTRAQLDAILAPAGFASPPPVPLAPAPTRPHLTAALLGDLGLFQRELQDNIDLEDEPRYAAMITTLRTQLNSRALTHALYRPDFFPTSRPYPLYASEIAKLALAFGVAISAKTIERLAYDGLISPPLLIGAATLPRPIYFARHLVEILYARVILNLKPERAKTYLDVLSGQLDSLTLLYFSALPYVRPELIKMATTLSAPTTLTV